MDKLLCILSFLLVGCAQQTVSPGCHHTIFGHSDNRLQLQNNSNIVVTPAIQDDYPDTSTSIYKTTSFYIAYGKQVANPGQRLIIPIRDCLENYFSEIPSGKMQIFIYDASLFDKMSWDTIAAKHLYLKKYIFTEDSLKSMNWIVTYP